MSAVSPKVTNWQYYIGIKNNFRNKSLWCSYISVFQVLFHLDLTIEYLKKNPGAISTFFNKMINKRVSSPMHLKDVLEDLEKEGIQIQENSDPSEFLDQLYAKFPNLFKCFEITEKSGDSTLKQIKVQIAAPEEDETSILELLGESHSFFDVPTMEENIQRIPSDYYCISINRNDNSNLNTKKIEINIKFSQQETPEKKNSFELLGFIYNTNENVNQGHFITVMKVQGNFVFYNDSNVSFRDKTLPIHDISYIEKHIVLLFYQKIPYDTNLNPGEMLTNEILDSHPNLIPKPATAQPKVPKAGNSKNTVTIDIERPINREIRDIDAFNYYIPEYSEEDKNKITEMTHQVIDESKTSEDIKKTNLADHFRYLVGRLDIDTQKSIPFPCEIPKHHKQEKIVQLITWCCNIMNQPQYQFASRTDDNENLIIDKLKAPLLSGTSEQVKIAGEAVYQILIAFLPNNVTFQQLEKSVNEELKNLISDTSVMNQEEAEVTRRQIIQDKGDEYSSTFTMENFVWQEFFNPDLYELIIDKQKLDKKMADADIKRQDKWQKKKNILELWKSKCGDPEIDYCIEKFIPIALHDQEIHSSVHSKPYHGATIKKIISAYKRFGKEPSPIQPKGDSHKKFPDAVFQCLFTLLITFPEWTDSQRRDYLMSPRGPLYIDEKNSISIHVKTVNLFINSISFTIKKAQYSPAERNTFGSKVMRYVWAKCVQDLLKDKDIYFIFIDESGLSFPDPRTCRGYIGVNPIITKRSTSSNITIATAVLPGFGTISRFYTGGFTGYYFSEFIRNISFVIRTYIDSKCTIISVLDNVRLHKTNVVQQAFKDTGILPLPTVRYSPMLNFPVENCFGLNKKYIEESKIRSEVSFKGTYKAILKIWKDADEQNGGSLTTSRQYHAWTLILQDCLTGNALSNKQYSDHPRSLQFLVTLRDRSMPISNEQLNPHIDESLLQNRIPQNEDFENQNPDEDDSLYIVLSQDQSTENEINEEEEKTEASQDQ